MDNLEQFLKENRLCLDTESLDDLCWNKIDGSFKKHKRKKIVRQIYVAASILLIIGFGTVAIQNKIRIHEIQSISIQSEYSELAKQETSFRQVINVKVNEIKKQSVPVAYKGMFDGFVLQLQLIDQQYNLYINEVEQHGYNDELVQQIIYNYQLKISVLQMLQTEMNKINHLSKNEKNENINIQLQI